MSAPFFVRAALSQAGHGREESSFSLLTFGGSLAVQKSAYGSSWYSKDQLLSPRSSECAIMVLGWYSILVGRLTFKDGPKNPSRAHR